MADLVALKTTLRDLERQTREARDAYYVALIEDFGLKEGDEIEAQFYGKAIRDASTLRFNGKEVAGR